ncbi:competence protein CoiA, partial [Streptococcus agalactiae]|nr:competence protein CoiA [Streptococcus agalactiae]
NLLTQELMMFFPQIQQPRVDTDFCQINNYLTSFYQNFTNYYQKNKNNLDQTLYPPVFYDKIVTKN